MPPTEPRSDPWDQYVVPTLPEYKPTYEGLVYLRDKKQPDEREPARPRAPKEQPKERHR